MKSLGLIGGTSWHSTIEYYSTINQTINEHFGDNTNPPLLVYTLNHALIRQYQKESNWGGIAGLLIEASRSLQKAGVEAVMFCANTQHKVYDTVLSQIEVPILHIADATAAAIQAAKLNKVCFLGTKFTMVENFITDRIENSGIRVLRPEAPSAIAELHRIIQEELTYGKVEAASKNYVLQAIQAMVDKGAQGVILGCTEFPMMVQSEDLTVPIFNTAKIHAHAGVEFILAGKKISTNRK